MTTRAPTSPAATRPEAAYISPEDLTAPLLRNFRALASARPPPPPPGVRPVRAPLLKQHVSPGCSGSAHGAIWRGAAVPALEFGYGEQLPHRLRRETAHSRGQVSYLRMPFICPDVPGRAILSQPSKSVAGTQVVTPTAQLVVPASIATALGWRW